MRDTVVNELMIVFEIPTVLRVGPFGGLFFVCDANSKISLS